MILMWSVTHDFLRNSASVSLPLVLRASSNMESMPLSLSTFCRPIHLLVASQDNLLEQSKHSECITYAQAGSVLFEQRLAVIRGGVATQVLCLVFSHVTAPI